MHVVPEFVSDFETDPSLWNIANRCSSASHKLMECKRLSEEREMIFWSMYRLQEKVFFVWCIIKNAYYVQNSKCEENSQIKAFKILRSWLFSFHLWDRDEKTSKSQK